MHLAILKHFFFPMAKNVPAMTVAITVQAIPRTERQVTPTNCVFNNSIVTIKRRYGIPASTKVKNHPK